MKSRPGLTIPQLPDDPGAAFPDPRTALSEPDGLLAWGGDLDPLRLTHAYQQGIFPWYGDEQPILWWSPSQRCVLIPKQIHVSRRLQRSLQQGRMKVTVNLAFEQVVHGCALPRDDQDSTWITPQMAEAYQRLHQLGQAHSVEVWQQEKLVGGIYGLALGRLFFGESMFSQVANASKVAMVTLCRFLAAENYALLDCQISNPHLLQMGAMDISRNEFLTILAEHVDLPAPNPTFSKAMNRFLLAGP